MEASYLKRLSGAVDRQHFIRELAEMLSPYGSIRRSQLVVDEKNMDTEVLCFIEMGSPQQAQAAEKGLGMLLLDGCYLFFSTQLGANFAG